MGNLSFFKGAVLEDNREQWDRERGQKGEQGESDQNTLHTIKNKGAGRVVHACDPITQEAEVGGSLQVQASLGLHTEHQGIQAFAPRLPKTPVTAK